LKLKQLDEEGNHLEGIFEMIEAFSTGSNEGKEWIYHDNIAKSLQKSGNDENEVIEKKINEIWKLYHTENEESLKSMLKDLKRRVENGNDEVKKEFLSRNDYLHFVRLLGGFN
jgi:gas vesicle protein